MRTSLVLSAAVLVLTTAACTPKISDTLEKFAQGINGNNADKVSPLISKEAEDYNALSNNNWAGLSEQVDLWHNQAPFTFTDLEENIDGDTATVICTAEMGTGTSPSYFEMRQEPSFFIKTWKIKKWKIDASGDGFPDDDFRIQRIMTAP
jgi:hypothetical protein